MMKKQDKTEYLATINEEVILKKIDEYEILCKKFWITLDKFAVEIAQYENIKVILHLAGHNKKHSDKIESFIEQSECIWEGMIHLRNELEKLPNKK